MSDETIKTIEDSLDSFYYTLDEVEKIYARINELHLEYDKSLDEAPLTKMQAQFNGVGCDWMPATVRKALSKLLKLKATTAVHDWDYYKSDGDKLSQELVDLRFFANGHREIYAMYHWLNPYRYWSLYKLTTAYNILKSCGESAYKAAYETYNAPKTDET